MSDYMSGVALIGCGPMARAHAKALQAMGVSFIVYGRRPESAKQFVAEIDVEPRLGGVEAAREDLPSRAIVAVDVPSLEETTRALLRRGVREILVEKPAAMTPAGARALAADTARARARVFVAYNRRFYASVQRAREIVAADGGATSCRFEFTERAAYIAGAAIAAEIKRHWFFANSTHVLDLAFHLAGAPASLAGETHGGLDWHPAGAVFAGAGRTAEGALFSYHADWTGPGRWGVEVVTRAHRLFLQPLEELRLQRAGAMSVEAVALGDDLDARFKPGVYRQLAAFISGEGADSLLPIAAHAERMAFYAQILSGTGGRTVAVEQTPARVSA
jgi:predicted dehydrogenase